MAVEIAVFDSHNEVEEVLLVGVWLMPNVQVIFEDGMKVLALYCRHLQNLPQHDLISLLNLL